MSVKISLIIPCLDEEQRLGPTLRSVRQQAAASADLELIVVDGGSRDGTVALAQSAGAQVLECERGLGRQRNAGALAASGEWLAFVDADCSLQPDWVARAFARLEQRDLDVLCGSVLVPEAGTWVEQAWGVHLNARRRQVVHTSASGYRWIASANLLVRRDVFMQVGGFDEELSSAEDTELGYRLWRHGARIGYDSDLCVLHRGEPKTLRDFFRQQVWHSNREVYRKLAAAGALHRGRAFWFGALNAACLGAIACSAIASLFWHRPLLPAALSLGYALLPASLAGRTAWMAGSLRQAPALAVLYGAYGVARASYLLHLTDLVHKEARF